MTDTLNTVQDDLSPAENISMAAESAPAKNLATEIMVAAASDIAPAHSPAASDSD